MFKKLDFGACLRRIRKANNLSQFDFVSQLAHSHREFSSLSQTTLSLWENGRRLPSFLRRIAIARFFAEEYQLDEQESKFMQKVRRTELGGNPSIYPVYISEIVTVDLANLTQKQDRIITQGHKHFYNEELAFTLSAFPVSSYKVTLFINENAIVGHYIVNAAGLFVSFCFIDNSVALEMVLELEGKFSSVTIPTRSPAIASFFQDLHFEPYPTASRIHFYKGCFINLYRNPFFKDLLTNNTDLVRFGKVLKG